MDIEDLFQFNKLHKIAYDDKTNREHIDNFWKELEKK